MSQYDITCHQSEAERSHALDPKYVRRLSPDPSGGYTATIHELPGCIAEGETADEALAQLESVAQSWMESARASGYPITAPIDYEGASGKIALRISRRLHQLAAERADLEGVSLNQFIGNALAFYIGQQDGVQRMAKQLESVLSNSLRHTNIHILQVNQFTRESSASNYAITKTKYFARAASTDMTSSPALNFKYQHSLS